MEYCCHVWAGHPSYYLEILDKLQKQIQLLLAHCRNETSLSLFCRYYFDKCSSELAQLVPLPYSRGRSTRYCNRLSDVPVTIAICYEDFYANSFFPCTAGPWDFLP